MILRQLIEVLFYVLIRSLYVGCLRTPLLLGLVICAITGGATESETWANQSGLEC